jgi:type VI secretion system secreted protein VgrG
MARQVIVTVQCAGKALAPGQDFTALVLHQTLFDHHALALSVPFDSVEGSQAAFLTKTPGQLLGQPVSVTIAPNRAFELDKGPGFNFKGVITELSTSKDLDLQSSLAVQGYSPSCLLASGVQKRTFIRQTLQAIFTQVLAPYPENLLARQLNPRHAAPLPYVVQYQESNFAFLSRLATEYAEWFYYDGTSLQLGPPEAGAEQDFVADGVHNTFHLGLALNATKVKFYEYNYQQHQHYAATTQGQVVPALSQHPFGKLVLQQSEQLFAQESHTLAETRIQSGGEIQEEALAFHQQRVAELIALQGNSDDSSLQLGRVIRVRGEGLGSSHGQTTDFGAYRLVEITHHLDAEGNYSNTFTALPYLLDLPPHNPSYAPPAGVQELAEVIDTADPDQLGRVRVRYYWPVAAPTHAETDWVRTLTPYSGDGKGQLFTPEIGSQVLMGYANGLAEQPLVLGNLFHARNKQDAKYTTPSNTRKGLQTAGGNKFVMSDTQGEQTILMSNSNNKGTAIEVGFKGDGSISIKSNGPISLTAGGNITLTATKDIVLTAENVTINARQKLAKTAKVVEMTGTDSVDITGKTTALNAGDTMTIAATSSLDVTGGHTASISSGKTRIH